MCGIASCGRADRAQLSESRRVRHWDDHLRLTSVAAGIVCIDRILKDHHHRFLYAWGGFKRHDSTIIVVVIFFSESSSDRSEVRPCSVVQ